MVSRVWERSALGERSSALDRAGSSRTRNRTGRIGELAALTLALALALVGCGGDGSGGASAAPATTADPPATAAPTTQAPTTTTRPAGERIPVLSGGKASRSDLRWVQRHLVRVHPDLKRMVGKADGRMGPQTRQALCVYRTIMKGLPSSLWKPVGKADLTSLARTRTLPVFTFAKQTKAKTVAWVSKDCQAVMEVVH